MITRRDILRSVRGSSFLSAADSASVIDAWDVALTKGLLFVHLSTLVAAPLHPASRPHPNPI